MRIALMAQDKKKEQMVRFCLSRAGLLSRNEIFSTGTTGKMVAEATGLPIRCFLTGKQGGDQQIAERVAYGEIDLLIFFRDTLTSAPVKIYDDLLRTCDIYGVPYATNLATAEALLSALARGELHSDNAR